jgi:hypothetical protein
MTTNTTMTAVARRRNRRSAEAHRHVATSPFRLSTALAAALVASSLASSSSSAVVVDAAGADSSHSPRRTGEDVEVIGRRDGGVSLSSSSPYRHRYGRLRGDRGDGASWSRPLTATDATRTRRARRSARGAKGSSASVGLDGSISARYQDVVAIDEILGHFDYDDAPAAADDVDENDIVEDVDHFDGIVADGDGGGGMGGGLGGEEEEEEEEEDLVLAISFDDAIFGQ